MKYLALLFTVVSALAQDFDETRYTWFSFGTNVMTLADGWRVYTKKVVPSQKLTNEVDGTTYADPGRIILEFRRGSSTNLNIWQYTIWTSGAGTGKVDRVYAYNKLQLYTNGVYKLYSTTNLYRYGVDTFDLHMAEFNNETNLVSLAIDFTFGEVRFNTVWDSFGSWYNKQPDTNQVVVAF